MYEMTDEEKCQMDEVYSQMAAEEINCIYESNKVMRQCCALRGKSFKKYLKRVIEETEVRRYYEPFSIVGEPDGHYQTKSGFGSITGYWVNQWCTSMEGDSFSGYITVIIKKGMYLKMPFNC